MKADAGGKKAGANINPRVICAGLSVVTAQWLEMSAAAGRQLRCQQLSADALLGLQPAAAAAPGGAPAAEQDAGPADSGDTSAAAPPTTSSEPAAPCTRAWSRFRRTSRQRRRVTQHTMHRFSMSRPISPGVE